MFEGVTVLFLAQFFGEDDAVLIGRFHEIKTLATVRLHDGHVLRGFGDVTHGV